MLSNARFKTEFGVWIKKFINTHNALSICHVVGFIIYLTQTPKRYKIYTCVRSAKRRSAQTERRRWRMTVFGGIRFECPLCGSRVAAADSSSWDHAIFATHPSPDIGGMCNGSGSPIPEAQLKEARATARMALTCDGFEGVPGEAWGD